MFRFFFYLTGRSCQIEQFCGRPTEEWQVDIEEVGQIGDVTDQPRGGAEIRTGHTSSLTLKFNHWRD